MKTPACGTAGCTRPVAARFTWPGRNEQTACLPCAVRAEQISKVMGFYLQVIPMLTEENAAVIADDLFTKRK